MDYLGGSLPPPFIGAGHRRDSGHWLTDSTYPLYLLLDAYVLHMLSINFSILKQIQYRFAVTFWGTQYLIFVSV